jgi:hypothetical protein
MKISYEDDVRDFMLGTVRSRRLLELLTEGKKIINNGGRVTIQSKELANEIVFDNIEDRHYESS